MWDAHEEEGDPFHLKSQGEMEGRNQKVVNYFTKQFPGNSEAINQTEEVKKKQTGSWREKSWGN